jgi:hypothetical protein
LFRFVHDLVSLAFTISTQEKNPEPTPVKTMAVLTMPDGPKLLTGSTDGLIKVSCIGQSFSTGTGSPSLLVLF